MSNETHVERPVDEASCVLHTGLLDMSRYAKEAQRELETAAVQAVAKVWPRLIRSGSGQRGVLR